MGNWNESKIAKRLVIKIEARIACRIKNTLYTALAAIRTILLAQGN